MPEKYVLLKSSISDEKIKAIKNILGEVEIFEEENDFIGAGSDYFNDKSDQLLKKNLLKKIGKIIKKFSIEIGKQKIELPKSVSIYIIDEMGDYYIEDIIFHDGNKNIIDEIDDVEEPGGDGTIREYMEDLINYQNLRKVKEIFDNENIINIIY